ncbi:MAG: enoyl-CoA hydratase/isomerase family protein, partial [Actinomycetota bacterium]
MTGLISLERDDRIAVVSLNRPQAHNALSGAMADELAETMRSLARDDDVWAVLLRANGDKAFCVGADLKERSSFDLDDYHTNRKQIRGHFETIRVIPQPTIAA